MNKTWWEKILIQEEEINFKLNNADLPVKEMIDLQKELAKLRDFIDLAYKINSVQRKIEMANELLDAGLDEVYAELRELRSEMAELDFEYQALLKKKNPKDNKLILEIRAGTGGQEASLFAKLLVCMYQALADEKKWTWDVFSVDLGNVGGINAISSISIGIEGDDCLYYMEHESGVHRVQRVPITESCGRTHTSTATVAVLGEPEETEVKIEEEYLRTDVFRASGAGGQHVNKTESAVRLTYEHPNLEKIVVAIQDERSQHRNRDKAMKILRAKIAQQIKIKTDEGVSEARRNQIGTGDRCDKIRTYNFQQNRVTDHRSGVSIHNIQKESLLHPKDLIEITKPLRELSNG